MNDTFERNLKALSEIAPDLHRLLKRIKSPTSRLVRVSDNDWDIAVGEQRLYGGSSRTFTEKQTKWFLSNSSTNRMMVQPPLEYRDDPYAGGFLKALRSRASAAGIVVESMRQDARAPHLIVFGVGLGHHLPIVSDALDSRYIVMVEPHAEFLYHSLFAFDWVDFVEGARRRGRQLHFIVDDSVESLLHSVQETIRIRCNPALVDGTALFQNYGSPIFEQAARSLFANPDGLMAQLGFLDDEFWMVRNSFFNLRDADTLTFHRPLPRHDVPAFLIGAGPSLDNAIETLRKSRADAILVSCGTTLRALLKAGIVPDFHLELENVPQVYFMNKKLANEYDLSPIVLVASTTVDPRVKTLFKRTVLFVRQHLASHAMFGMGPATTLDNVTPNIANLGVSFCRELGAPEIYLFGIDLGARDPKRHHTAESPYATGELPFNWPLEHKVPGNLGGTVCSEPGYLLTKRIIEHDIRAHGQGKTYYNCSDGVVIVGAKPLPPERAVPRSRSEARPRALKSVLERFRPYTQEDFKRAWRPAAVTEAMEKEIAELRRIVNACNTPVELVDGIDGVIRRTNALPESEIKKYCFGSLRLATTAAYATLSRIPNETERLSFAVIAREELSQLLLRMMQAVHDFYAGLEHRAAEVQAEFFP